MIGLDTNVLARFYVNDPNDPEATHQQSLARQVFVESSNLFVPLTVILELEWVLRSFYGFEQESFVQVVRHLLGLPHVTVEHWERVEQSLVWHLQGLDFADALHLAASKNCQSFVSFDEKRFARRAKRLNIEPPIQIPKAFNQEH
ncbi:type II toxin-antitoxin system VapC family toxin [Candidatus Synechococcus calcipolaris G9]|uniref:Type II toxin-antitoxin system VapC family toxin n=1 Tax=Candidatus Synechococcus calcipolaris G9 TaxID=1497997 RepID=A0ABT6F3C5_9SYNE|nr:type II toxin-antitoxin system VapC family toxin [Candidatus Synechococcus calcipolaris]MDG2992373.1 type II toxin-antitoxin system VapC family toxin [Candidatus Synechococcus calcipolaris G9]